MSLNWLTPTTTTTPSQIRPLFPSPVQNSCENLPLLSAKTTTLPFFFKTLRKPLFPPPPPKSHQPPTTTTTTTTTTTQDDGIPIEDVKFIAKFKSRHNYIRVLEVSRRADHPLAGSRLLLLDAPGNIHSISFAFKSFTDTYYDVFATLPPILPLQGPIAMLGFGAGSAARLALELYPDVVIHGWELDPCVIDVGRKFFRLDKVERAHPDRVFIYIGNALNAEIEGGFSGIIVDLFSKGSLIPELQDPNTWQMLRKRLIKGGRVMVNVGGRCVEAEDKRRNGDVAMMDTLKAMRSVFGDGIFVLSLGNRSEDSSVAITGELPDLDLWRKKLPKPLRGYVNMWRRFCC